MKALPELFRDAAEVIRTRGWARYAYETAEGSVCAEGALNVAASGDAHQPLPECARALQALRRYHGGEFDLAAWNDDDHRTAREVIALFEDAARDKIAPAPCLR